MLEASLNSTMTETAGWFPVVTTLAGFIAGALTEWFRDWHATRREHQARKAKRTDDLFDRQVEFQRQTLLDLQEAIAQLGRATGAIHHQDDMAFRRTGRWERRPVGEDLSEEHRKAVIRTSMLCVRARDDEVRKLVDQLRTECTHALMAGGPEEAGQVMASAMKVFERANDRIGAVLRQLDEASVEEE